MSFYYTKKCERFPNLVTTCSVLPSVLKHPSFISKIVKVERFAESNISGMALNAYIQDFLRRDGGGIATNLQPLNPYSFMVTTTYVKWNRFSSEVGYFKGGNTYYQNERKINRPVSSFVNSGAHEFIHFLDQYTPENFGHAFRGYSYESAPYFVGDLAEKIYKEFYE